MEANAGRFVWKKLFWVCLALQLIISVSSVDMIRVIVAQETHDIAVVSVTPNATNVEKGELVGIMVVVENQGSEIETFSVTVCYDTTTIGTQNVLGLAAGANTSIAFTWDTGDVWIDTLVGAVPYKIKAVASTVLGETDTSDNTLVSPNRVRVVKSPYIGVFPHCTVSTNLTVGTTYTVSIRTDYNGSDITGWQFFLYYNPIVLHGIHVTNGDLITTDIHPDAKFFPGTFDNTNGKLMMTSALFLFITEPAPLTSGPGTLANVTFEVVGVGESSISLGVGTGETKLKGYTEGGYGNSYDIIEGFVDSDHIGQGYFNNVSRPPVHDVAVTSLNAPTKATIGDFVSINVIVANEGDFTESFIVTVCYDSSIVGTRGVLDLAPGHDRALTFNWNTTGVPSGDYTIIAVASPVTGETDIEDNFKTTTIEIKPFVFHVPELDFNIIIDSNSTLSNFDFREDDKELRFTVSGPTSTTGYCNVAIPMDKMAGQPWKIVVDSEIVTDVFQSDNGTHTFLYFKYTHSTKDVMIRGTWVVPEFPTSTPILLVLFLLSIAIAIYRRRLLKTPIR